VCRRHPRHRRYILAFIIMDKCKLRKAGEDGKPNSDIEEQPGPAAGAAAVGPHDYVKKNIFSKACRICGAANQQACEEAQAAAAAAAAGAWVGACVCVCVRRRLAPQGESCVRFVIFLIFPFCVRAVPLNII
jgi:hypothetical protein